MEPEKDILVLENLISQNASQEKMLEGLKNFKLPNQLDQKALGRLCQIFFKFMLAELPPLEGVMRDAPEERLTRRLYWYAEEHFLQIIYDRCFDNRKWVRERAARSSKDDPDYETEEEVAKKHNYPPVVSCLCSAEEIYEELIPFLKFQEEKVKKNPHSIYEYRFLLEIFMYSSLQIQLAFSRWLKEMESKDLIPENFEAKLKRAIKLFNRNICSDLQEFQDMFKLLNEDHLVLRAAAANMIGSTYDEFAEEDGEFNAHPIKPVYETMMEMSDLHKKGGHVLGGFISGLSGNEGLHILQDIRFFKENKFDIRNWILDAAKNSPEPEIYIPGTQAFWFYVHEYFDFDPEAVEELIESKKYWLAMMCAMESEGAYKMMEPSLKKLLAFGSPGMVDSINFYIDKVGTK